MSEPMSEDALNRIQAMLDAAVETVRLDLRGEIRASELRLAEGGRLQFQQLAVIYRSNLEKVEHLEKHLGERIDATRGAIESLRSSLERQDFRADELGRRIASLETRFGFGGSAAWTPRVDSDCDQAAAGVAGFCFTRATLEDRDLLVPKTFR